jgi:hypothetical protein
MRKKRLWVCLLLACLTAVVVAWNWDALFRKPGVTLANFRRLREGMSEQEVEAILGRPRDGYDRMTDNHFSSWTGKDGSIFLHFSDLGHYINGGQEIQWVGLLSGSFQDNSGRSEKLCEPQESVIARIRRLLSW